MVGFPVFNELSLPFPLYSDVTTKFRDFFQLLEATKKKGLDRIRMPSHFKNYEIEEGACFQQFMGRHKDRVFVQKLKTFLANGVVLVEEEIREHDSMHGLAYCGKNPREARGLLYAYTQNTLAISLNSDSCWNVADISLQKKSPLEDKAIRVRHASSAEHLHAHVGFFEELEKENRLGITQANIWNKCAEFFPSRICFCPEVEAQIKKLDSQVFKRAKEILRDIETGQKHISDYEYSGESETGRKNPQERRKRTFTVNGEKIYFEKHIKSLPQGHRMHFLEQGSKIYIGYIGKHL